MVPPPPPPLPPPPPSPPQNVFTFRDAAPLPPVDVRIVVWHTHDDGSAAGNGGDGGGGRDCRDGGSSSSGVLNAGTGGHMWADGVFLARYVFARRRTLLRRPPRSSRSGSEGGVGGT